MYLLRTCTLRHGCFTLHAHAPSFEINSGVGNEMLLLGPEASRQYSMVDKYESHESGEFCMFTTNSALVIATQQIDIAMRMVTYLQTCTRNCMFELDSLVV